MKPEAVFFIAVCAIAILFLLFGRVRGSDASNAVAVVTIDNVEFARYPLGTDTAQEIESNLGKNTFVIKDGVAYIESADCHNQICVKHPPIKGAGETIICLPHKLIIQIEPGLSPHAP